MNDLNYEYDEKDFFDKSLEDEIMELNETSDNQEDLDLSDYHNIGYDDVQSEQVNNPQIMINEMKQLTADVNLQIENNNNLLKILSQDIGNIKFEYEFKDSQDLINKKNILNNTF